MPLKTRLALPHPNCCQSLSKFLVLVSAGRRSAPPLNLTGLPGTEKLNEKEKEVRKGRKR